MYNKHKYTNTGTQIKNIQIFKSKANSSTAHHSHQSIHPAEHCRSNWGEVFHPVPSQLHQQSARRRLAFSKIHKYTRTKYTNICVFYTNTQIHKYTNTQAHKFTNTSFSPCPIPSPSTVNVTRTKEVSLSFSFCYNLL